jgi:hypothetical protein
VYKVFIYTRINIYIYIYIYVYTQNDKIKEDEMGRACSMNEEKRNAYRILV